MAGHGGIDVISQPPFDPNNPFGPPPLPFDPQSPNPTRTGPAPQLPQAPQARNTFGINERAGGGGQVAGPKQNRYGHHEDDDPEDDPNKAGGGFWDWLQNNQEIAGAALGTGVEAYGAYKQGQQQDREYEENVRRYENEEAREDERLRKRDEAYARIQDRRKARAAR